MEELDFQALLDRFHKDGFTRGEQVILANYGTNQTLLTLIFQKPCRLKLVAQTDIDGPEGVGYSNINRVTHLLFGDTLGCIAKTIIPIDRNRPDVLSDIIAGNLGLGQIVVTHNLVSQRKLLTIGRDMTGFWRTYTIEGPELYLKIHEYFPHQPFLDVGWEVGDGGKSSA